MKIACGDTHTLAVTDTGELYAFGRNQNGQLGIGSTNDALLPQHVEALKVWVTVECLSCSHHTEWLNTCLDDCIDNVNQGQRHLLAQHAACLDMQYWLSSHYGAMLVVPAPCNTFVQQHICATISVSEVSVIRPSAILMTAGMQC